jgi:hypothetical protein
VPTAEPSKLPSISHSEVNPQRNVRAIVANEAAPAEAEAAPAPARTFKDKIAMLSAIKGGGMLPHEYGKKKEVPSGEEKAEGEVEGEGQTPACGILERCPRKVRRPAALAGLER